MSNPRLGSQRGRKKSKSATALLAALIILGSIALMPMSTPMNRASAQATVPTSVYVDPQTGIKGQVVTVRGFIDEPVGPNPDLNNQTIRFELLDLEGNMLSTTIAPVVTDNLEFGDFTANFTAPSEAGYWNLTAYFDGDDTLLSSTGSAIFATAEEDAVEVEVSDGQAQYRNVSVSLTDFAFEAAVMFDPVPEDYLLSPINATISQCTSPDSSAQSRYLPLSFATADNTGNICLEVLPGPVQQRENDLNIQVNITYAGVETLPAGYSESNVDLFYFDPLTDEITEISATRDIANDQISGTAPDIGRFIVGIGLHGEAPDGAVRKHVLVGDDQPVMFRDIADRVNSTTSVVSTSPEEVTLEEPVTITLNYSNGNLDVDAVDTMSVRINSTSSTPDFVTIEFTETSTTSGLFTGSLTLTSGATSGSSLHASDTDTLTFTIPSKDSTDPRFRATLDGVSEPGVVELSDYELTEAELDNLVDSVGFTPVVGIVNVTFVDAVMDEFTGQIHVTMSYANSLIGPVDPSTLRIYQKSGLSWDASPPAATLDTGNLQVSATFDTEVSALFALAYRTGTPGGAGGGLGKPGVGVVLDFLVPFASPPPSSPPPEDEESSSSSSSSSGSSSSSSRVSTTTKQVSQGNDVQTTVSTEDGDTIEVAFESIVSDGTVTVEERSITDFSSIFDSVISSTRGGISIGNSQYSTTGSVFDIDASKLTFSGPIEVTIPYDEVLLKIDELSEEDVRFLHYDGSSWEDATIRIDIEANTVTGKLYTLSPVVVGVSMDGTFDPSYFTEFPLAKIKVTKTAFLNKDGASISQASVDQQVIIASTFTNHQQVPQNYAFIILILDQNDVAIDISWQEGTATSGQTINLSHTWTPKNNGTYTVKIFVWDAIDNPFAVSAGSFRDIIINR